MQRALVVSLVLAALGGAWLATRPAPSAPLTAAATPATPGPSATAPADAATASAAPASLELRTLAPGFEYGRWKLPSPSSHGDATLRFVRVDPRLVDLEVRAASLGDSRIKGASAWAAPDAGRAAVAVINTSMFRDDWLTSVGYLRVRGTIQNGSWASQQNALLALDPVGADVPALHNLGCADKDALVARYATLVQSIRMIGCDGKNVWAQEKRSWSSALVGADRAGRILFLHTRSPYTMHDLVDQLLASPLDLVGLHYGEGGPEASLYVRGPGFEEVNIGSYETGFEESDDNRAEWELPNVVVARSR